MEKNRRNDIIDIAKGIAVLLVILGHAIQRSYPNYTQNTIMRVVTSFHMPLFIFISGYVINLSKSELDGKWVKNKIEKLMYPYFIWYLIYYGFSNFSFTGLKPYLNYNGGFIQYLKRGIINPDNGLWFLWTLFFCYLGYFMVTKVSKKYNILIMIVISLTIQVITYNKFGIGDFVYYFPIFTAGYIIGRFKDTTEKYYLPISVMFSLLFPILFSKYVWRFQYPKFLNHIHDIDLRKLVAITYFYAIAFAGICIVYLVSWILNKIGIKSILSRFGRLSFEMYVCQGLVLNIGIGNGPLKATSILITATALSYLLSITIKRFKILDCLLFGSYKQSLINLSKAKV